MEDGWNARQMAYVAMYQAEMYAAMADVEALKAELKAMEANDRGSDAKYTEEAYLGVVKKIEAKAGEIRLIAGQIGTVSRNIS